MGLNWNDLLLLPLFDYFKDHNICKLNRNLPFQVVIKTDTDQKLLANLFERTHNSIIFQQVSTFPYKYSNYSQKIQAIFGEHLFPIF